MCRKIFSVVSLAAVLMMPATALLAQSVSIGRTNFWWNGAPAEVPITAEGVNRDLAGFDLLIALTEPLMNMITVDEGDALVQSGWEYFTFSKILDSLGLYPLGDASAMIRIHAFRGDGLVFADPAGTHELARLRMLPTYSPETECMFLPLRLFWRDCNDNVLYTAGDTALTVDTTIDMIWPPPNPYAPPEEGYVSPTDCGEPPAPAVERILTAHNGGIDFVCSDSVDLWRGDVNLDGKYMTMADLVMFQRYFYFGLAVFPWPPEAAIAMTDINLDGITLTVADFVLLYKYISGDRYIGDYSKPVASAGTVGVVTRRDPSGVTFELESASDIAAAWFRFNASDGAVITVDNAPVQPGRFDGEHSFLLFDMEDLAPAVPAGERLSIRIDDPNAALTHAEPADPFARNMKVVESGSLPISYALYQNYPNPFNPSTSIGFYLPDESDWTLDIFDITGRFMETRSGHGQGELKIDWNAAPYCSGVYLYRLRAGAFEETKRMVLLK